MRRNTSAHSEAMARAATLYYLQELSQDQIASAMGLTRWTVGRLLKDAKEMGVVEIRVRNPFSRRYELELELKAKFGLKDAVVVQEDENSTDTLKAVAQAGAEYLANMTPHPKVLGVSWGRTLAAFAGAIPESWSPEGMQVVQINGGVSQATSPFTGSWVLQRVASQTKSPEVGIPTPAIVSTKLLAHNLRMEPIVASSLALARKADTLVFSLGMLSPDSVLVKSGCLDQNDVDALVRKQAVGDVVGHFLTQEGKVAMPSFENRIIGLSLEEIKNAPNSIAVASGDYRLPMVQAVLTARICSVLVIDSSLATAVLK